MLRRFYRDWSILPDGDRISGPIRTFGFCPMSPGHFYMGTGVPSTSYESIIRDRRYFMHGLIINYADGHRYRYTHADDNAFQNQPEYPSILK